MRRSVTLAVLILLVATSSAWSKFKQDEEKYLSDQFGALNEQLHAMGNEVAALKAELAELKQSQAQLQELVARQSRSLEELQKLVAAERAGNEESFAKLGKSVTDARRATEAGLSRLAPAAEPQTTTAAPGTAARPAEGAHGFITNVDGTDVIIDMGSASGIQVGTQLGVYKAADRNAQVGTIQVVQVMDANTSKARIVSVNAGVKLDFSDEARLQ